jgi:DNA-directed RNA polymerase specialized sigma24 family protein
VTTHQFSEKFANIANCVGPHTILVIFQEVRMPDEGSVTHWLDQARAGDAEAAQQLWQRYFERLVGLARVKLRGAPHGMVDEEDVALSAFDSLYRGIEDGRFPQLHDRDNLWSLLVVITARKAANWKRDQSRQKRAGLRTEGVAAGGERGSVGTPRLEEVISHEPSPEFAAQLAEECQRLFDGLGEEMLRTIARCKMEGYTNAEIAEQLKCAPRTVERKLALIRGRWEKENEP